MNALHLSHVRPMLLGSIRRASTVPHPHTQINGQGSIIPLSNIEAQWETLSNPDKVATSLQLEELQKKNWKELTLQEKKASESNFFLLVSGLTLFLVYYVAFGPHGPRTPRSPPGSTTRIVAGTLACLVVSGIVYQGIRSMGKTRFADDKLKLQPVSSTTTSTYYIKGMAGGVQ